MKIQKIPAISLPKDPRDRLILRENDKRKNAYYTGNTKNNLPHGKGIYFKNNGGATLHIDGEWDQGKLNGMALVLKNCDGQEISQLYGNWYQNTFHGQGNYISQSHHKLNYIGHWNNGQKHGPGQFKFTVNINNKPNFFTFHVTFNQGKLTHIAHSHGPFDILSPGHYGDTSNDFGFIIDKDRNLQCGTFKETRPEYNRVIPISTPLAEKGRALFCKNYEHPPLSPKRWGCRETPQARPSEKKYRSN
jgi:hypothetical protein